MKYGLLVTSPVGPKKNIGDYMQSLAALQFLPALDCYIEKEDIAHFSYKEKVKAIMNAWYIWHPENWPPQENAIDPLLTSIHITPITAEKMLADGGKEYFKSHEPIGCRDKGTVDILRSHGIDAFFSGCMTLTLGYKYEKQYERHGVCFVDPYIPPFRFVSDDNRVYYPLNIVKAIIYLCSSPLKIAKISKKSFFKGKFLLQTLYNASMFYHSYSDMFSDHVLFNAIYKTHMVPINGEETQEELLKQTEDLLDLYSKMNYVVTSRIHCALPCLGINTPVIFVLNQVMNSSKNIFGSPGRFGGLIDFFRVASFRGGKILPEDKVLKKISKFEINSKFENKRNCDKYKSNLIDTCLNFVNLK